MPWLAHPLTCLAVGAGVFLLALAIVRRLKWGRVADACAALFLAVLVGGVFALERSNRDPTPDHANNVLAQHDSKSSPAPNAPAAAEVDEQPEVKPSASPESPSEAGDIHIGAPPPQVLQGEESATEEPMTQSGQREQTVQNREPPEIDHLQRQEPSFDSLPKAGPPEADPPLSENPPKTVDFFKTSSEAESVVYVVDRSGSMAGTRFARAADELRRSIGKLKRGQSFYASFFSDGPLLMFGEQSPSGLVPATPATVSQINNWLDTVTPGGGTSPEQSMQIAAGLKPDVIYLLSDGEFGPLQASTMQLLIDNKIKVNTIAFENSAGGELLKDISNQTGGVYRFVPASNFDLPIDFASRLSPENQERLRQIVDGAENVWELTHGAGQGPPSLMEEMFALLLDDDPALRNEVMAVLERFTGGVTFDLADTATLAEREQVVDQWRQWYVTDSREGFHGLLKGTADRREAANLMRAMIDSANVHERWGLARYVARHWNPMMRELLVLIADEDPDVRAEAKVRLMKLSQVDFGPRADANETEREFAARQWRRWWELHQAQRRFDAQVTLIDSNPQAAHDNLRKLARNYPDTPLAQRAEALADHLSAQLLPDATSAPETTAATEDDERDAEAKLRVTARLFRDDPVTLRAELESLIQQYPDTTAAGQARKVLLKYDQLAAQADFQAARTRAESIARMSAAQRSALLAEIVGFANTYPHFPAMGEFAEEAALRLERVHDFRLAAQAYGEFTRIFAASSNRENQQRAEAMAKSLRRCRLPGNLLELVGDTLDGDPFDWEQFRGKWVVVVFWSAATPGVEAELMAWQAQIDALGRDRLATIAVNLDENPELWKEHLAQHATTLPCLASEHGPQPTANYYGITASPYFVLVNADAMVLMLTADRGEILHKLGEEFSPTDSAVP